MAPSRNGKWWALAALSLTSLVVGLDATVLNLALPTLATELKASTASLQWFVVAYSLVFAALLIPAGLLGDRYGRKRLLLSMLALFGAASLGCAFSPSAGALIAARAVLGIGAAFLLPLSMAVLPVIFPEEERSKAIAVWVASTAISFPIGPILGGWLLSNYWWGSVFLINVPVVAVALVAVAVFLPESKSSTAPKVDLVGAASSSLGLAAFVYGVIQGGDKGWTSAEALAFLCAGVLVLAFFMLWQRRQGRNPDRQPLVDPWLFRSRSFAWGAILATLVSFAMFGVLFTLPQYLQEVTGESPLGTGLRLLPMIGGLFVASQLGEQLARRAGAKVVVALGFVMLAGSLMMGAATSYGDPYSFVAIWLSAMGLGLGFALPTSMDAALGALSVERSGVGSGVVMALRQVGGTIGVAILGAVLAFGYHSGLDLTGVPATAAGAAKQSVSAGVAVAGQLGSTQLLDSARSAFVHGMDMTLWVCGGLMVLGILLALAFLPQRITSREPETSHLIPSANECLADE